MKKLVLILAMLAMFAAPATAEEVPVPDTGCNVAALAITGVGEIIWASYMRVFGLHIVHLEWWLQGQSCAEGLTDVEIHELAEVLWEFWVDTMH